MNAMTLNNGWGRGNKALPKSSKKQAHKLTSSKVAVSDSHHETKPLGREDGPGRVIGCAVVPDRHEGVKAGGSRTDEGLTATLTCMV